MKKNYSIQGQLYLDWSNSTDVTVKVQQKDTFVNAINKLLHELFVIPADRIVWTECEWNGRITISGKYRFESDDIVKMDRILVLMLNTAAEEAGVSISGDVHFSPDLVGWELRS